MKIPEATQQWLRNPPPNHTKKQIPANLSTPSVKKHDFKLDRILKSEIMANNTSLLIFGHTFPARLSCVIFSCASCYIFILPAPASMS